MMEYVKTKGVYCPSCGKSRKVELYREWNGIGYDYLIRCRHEGVLYQIINRGVYPTYDSPEEEQ